MVTYGTTAIPSDQITVQSGGTVAISVAFENSVGLVGGMDTANGTATEGEVQEVQSPTDARDLFGDGSELHEQVQLAYNNGAGTVYALGVPETSVTGETHTSQDGTLDNAPLFDPRVNEEHSVTVEDTGGGTLTVNYVDEPPTSAPSEADSIDIYPPTGDYYADAVPDGTNYDFDYDYGDYSASAMKPLLDESPRMIGVLTENESVANDVATELNSRATDFDFMHAVVNAPVNVDAGNYTDSLDERRVSAAYPARAFTDSSQTNEERTAGAIAGYLAGIDLGISATNDSLGGFAGGLKNELTGPSEAGDLIDEQVMPLLNYPPITIVKDMTTSTEPKFERVYAMQIVDEITDIAHAISREFIGDQNTASNRAVLGTSLRNAYVAAETGTPPLLDDFTVDVQEDTGNDNKVNVEIGIDVVDVMDIIDVTVTVGDIIRNNGAT